MRLPAIPELAAPLPAAMVALLALNDHVLKRAWPGVVTGKLSDIAGCFVLPLFVSTLLGLVTRWERPRRLALGAAATTVFFAAIKLSSAAAHATARALDVLWAPITGTPGRIVADPTDLIALPLVMAAVAFGLRAGAAVSGSGTCKESSCRGTG